MKKLCLVMSAVMLSLSLAAVEFLIKNDREMPVYKCGEPAKFTVSAFDNGQLIKEGKYTAEITLDGNKVLEKKAIDFAIANPVDITATLKQPGFMLVRLRNAKGAVVTAQDAKGRKVAVLAGAGFDPEKIKMGYDCPEDFMAFWESGRKLLADQPIKLEKVVKKSTPAYTTYYVTVDSLNNEKITGYLTVPTGKGPFPAYITVPGAGPGFSGPATQYADKAITLAMNVHKFPTADNAKEQKERYAADQKISRYTNRGAGNRDLYFFRSTYVGIDRAINHVAQMPEWDHKHMVVDGSSQGGGSSLILAGYNKNITALAANVPALCDHGGDKLGRSAGWPRLSSVKANNADSFAPYFDAANFARFVKVPALVSCGFIDTTCSPSSVYAAYNQLKGPKTMVHVPLEGHTTSKIYGAQKGPFVLKHLGLKK